MSEIPYKQFEPANEFNDTWFQRLNEENKQKYLQFVAGANQALAWARLNGVPRDTHDAAEALRKRANSTTFVSDEALYALDTEVARTIWEADIFDQLMAGIPGVQQTLANPRWQIKDYLITSKEVPRFTRSGFRNPVFVNMAPTTQYTNGLGVYIGVQLPFDQIDESKGGLWDPYVELSREAAAKQGLQKSRRGFLGSACQGALGEDGSDCSLWGVTGLFNYASAGTFNAGVGDMTITTSGDFETGLQTGLADLKTCYQPGTIVLVTTSSVFCEVILRRDTYQQKTDLTRIQEHYVGPGKPIQQWWITDQLRSSAVDTTHGQAMLIKLGPSTVNHKIIYPQQTVPVMDKLYERDIAEVLLYADAVQFKKYDSTNNVVPVTVAADITTSTAGWLMPQRVV